MAGQKINDHGFWAGKAAKDCVMPDGAKMKALAKDGNEQHLGKYQDNQEAIHQTQKAADGKMRAHSQKDGMRY